LAESEAAVLGTLAAAARAAGIAITEVSAGTTPTARFSLEQGGLTEYRPGNYVYFDRTQVGLGAASLDDCALSVLARVVSKPSSDRLVLDSGSKTLSSDGARGFTPAAGHGAVLGHDDLLIERLSEEHATLRAIKGSTPLEPGDVVRVLPNHACVVSNLVDEAWLVDGATVAPLPIAARGRIT
jgi:D-serine deaminase-like pyridoxal phosphate-dependent protein